MAATLNTMSFQEVKVATEMSLGRNIATADRLEMTAFDDCVRNDFWWTDGACSTWTYDTKAEAASCARRAGFSA